MDKTSDSFFKKYDHVEDTDLTLQFRGFPKMKSPGRIDKMHHMKELMELHKYLFTGFQMNISYVLDRRFIVGHALALGKDSDPMQSISDNEDSDRATYAMNAQYNHKNYQLHGSVATNGMASSAFIFKKGGLFLLFSGQAVEDKFALDVDLSYEFVDSLIEARYHMKDVGLAFTQAITPRLSFGAEYMIGFEGYVFNRFIFRHKDKEARTRKTVSLLKGTQKNEVRLYYSKKITKYMEILSSIRISKKKSFNSNWYFGYVINSQRGMIKSLIDGSGTVSTLMDFPFSQNANVNVCGTINYRLNSYDFGFGISAQI